MRNFPWKFTDDLSALKRNHSIIFQVNDTKTKQPPKNTKQASTRFARHSSTNKQSDPPRHHHGNKEVAWLSPLSAVSVFHLVVVVVHVDNLTICNAAICKVKTGFISPGYKNRNWQIGAAVQFGFFHLRQLARVAPLLSQVPFEIQSFTPSSHLGRVAVTHLPLESANPPSGVSSGSTMPPAAHLLTGFRQRERIHSHSSVPSLA